MKKRWMISLCAAVLALLMAGCGSQQNTGMPATNAQQATEQPAANDQQTTD